MKAITINFEEGKVYRSIDCLKRLYKLEGSKLMWSTYGDKWEESRIKISYIPKMDFEEVQQYKPVDENTKPGTMILVNDENNPSTADESEFIGYAGKIEESKFRVVGYNEKRDHFYFWKYGWEKLW